MLLNKRISIKYFLNTIKYDLLTISVYAIAIGYLDNYSFFRNQTIPLALTGVVGTAVSLLLAFRTSQSYDRWWEARVVWGAIVNDSRTLIRQVETFYDGPDKVGFVKDFGYRQIFWCYALAGTLRKTKLPADCQAYVDSLDLNDDNIPNGMLSVHSRMIRQAFIEGNINQFQQIQLDATVIKLCDAMGKCERIKSTVFPTSYSTLIHFLIYFLVTVLPFGIDDNHIVLEVFLCIAIPSVFIAIEKTSILMQDPFENLPLDTPMTAISRTIEKNIMQMIEEPVATPVATEDTYFIL
jgi:putative membrane protein